MLLVKNKKAMFDHTLVEKFTAGISLTGYEVKAIKEHKVNFEGSYVQLLGGDIPVVVNLHIGRFTFQSQKIADNETRRTRPLLLNKKEIQTLKREFKEKGKTAIPLALILDHNLIKLELAVVKGKKKAEKKHLEKERQMKKDMEIMSKDLRL